MMRCGYCDAATTDLKLVTIGTYGRTPVCADCRYECPRCGEMGLPEEGHFLDGMCRDCYYAEHGPPDRYLWPYEHLTRAAND